MVALNGHEAGNGGHSQEVTYRHRARLRPRASSDVPPAPAGRGKPWTRGEVDQRGRADTVKAPRSQRNQDGEG